MKTIAMLGWLGSGILCLAQQDAPKEDLDLQARRQSVVAMREQIAMRDARLAKVVARLKETGDGIDQRIGGIVDSLARIKDSESSKMRISQLKGEAAAGLMRMIEVYQAERRDLVEQAKKDPDAPLEAIGAIVRRIDERINERAAEVMKLVDSIPGAKDVEKYESAGGSYYGNGWGWTNERISDTWRQNRRDSVQSRKKRGEAQKALEAAIANLEDRRNEAASQLKRDDLTEVEREIQKFELDHLNSVLEIRRSQLVEVTMPSAEPSEMASRDEAADMSNLFQDAVGQLRDDFNDNLRLYRQAKAENEKLFKLKQNLAAREKWLSENDPDWKPAE